MREFNLHIGKAALLGAGIGLFGVIWYLVESGPQTWDEGKILYAFGFGFAFVCVCAVVLAVIAACISPPPRD